MAVGYGEAHVPITGEGPTTITLDKTTLLEVEVLDARAQPDERLRLHLLSEQRLFFDNGIGPAHAYGLLGASRSRAIRASPNGADISLTSPPGEPGRFQIFDIQPGIPFRIEVRDAFNHTMAYRVLEAMSAREHRVERIRVANELHDLRGRVLDQHGRPARCTVRMMGVSVFQDTDEDGRFSFSDVGGEGVWLRVTSGTFAQLDYRCSVPKGGDLGDLILEPSNTLQVRVVDTNGMNLKAHVTSLPEGMGASHQRHFHRGEEGLNQLFHLASGDIKVDIRVGGVSHERTIRLPRLEPFELVLPVHGGVKVVGLEVFHEDPKGGWNPYVGAGWRAYLAPIDEDRVLIEDGLASEAKTSLLEPILPGRYHLRLQEWQPSPLAGHRDLIKPRVVQVVAGQVTVVDL